MMRIFAVLLSVYILVLSGIACEDHQHGDFVQASISTELSVDMQNHNGADICNPFFFCHAGHHIFFGEEIHFLQIKSEYSQLTEDYKPDYLFTILIPIWNPPKA